MAGQCVAQAPRKGDARYEEIDAEEGRRRLAHFRNQRLDGDYCFRFELEHLPRRAQKVRYSGTLWGSWNDVGPVTRLRLSVTPDVALLDAPKVVELLLQNGAEPSVWLRDSLAGDFKRLQGDELMRPILPGIVYSPFDLQMPFIYWKDFEYEGPDRVKSRVAQTFLMRAPVEDSAVVGERVDSVRIGIDDVYNALLRIEVLGTGGDVRSQFTVESFKKVQAQYIVKQVVLKDLVTKDRTRFEVKQASVGLLLDDAWFLPLEDAAEPVIPSSRFEEL